MHSETQEPQYRNISFLPRCTIGKEQRTDCENVSFYSTRRQQKIQEVEAAEYPVLIKAEPHALGEQGLQTLSSKQDKALNEGSAVYECSLF